MSPEKTNAFIAPPATEAVAVPDGVNAFTAAVPPPPGGVAAQQGLSQQPVPGSMPQMPALPRQMPIVYQAPRMDQGVPPGAANAFTLAGTERPIPANFGPSAQVPNAFGDGNTATVAYVPMRPNQNQLAMYQQQLPAGASHAPMSDRTANGPAPSPESLTSAQLMAVLKDNLFPTKREAAAEELANRDWHASPEIATALVKAAKEDPAATVRVECLHSLVHMKVNTGPAIDVCQALKNDNDLHVRQEAEQALFTLQGPGNANNVIRPASLTVPK
jgi:hypothetical protein